MIKITDMREEQEEEVKLPELPFFTMDDYGHLNIYLKDYDGAILCFDVKRGTSDFRFRSVKEAVEKFDYDEKIVDVEIIVKNRNQK